MLKNIAIQFLLGLGLALITVSIVEISLTMLNDIGWHFLTVIYITILFLQIIFYYLATNFNIGWTVLSFILNFILWTFEQVIIEKSFHDSFIYQSENWKIGAYILGALLWVINKILIDELFKFNKSIHRKSSIINAL